MLLQEQLPDGAQAMADMIPIIYFGFLIIIGAGLVVVGITRQVDRKVVAPALIVFVVLGIVFAPIVFQAAALPDIQSAGDTAGGGSGMTETLTCQETEQGRQYLADGYGVDYKLLPESNGRLQCYAEKDDNLW